MKGEAASAAGAASGGAGRWRLFIALPLAVFLPLYLLTLTDVHTYDALSYILDVDRKPWGELFHPHHLAYGPLGALIKAFAVALGWPDSAERLLQLANAVAGAFGVVLFGALLARAAGVRAGATGALLLGASYAYWYYAVEVEVYTIAAALLVASLGLMLTLARDPSPHLAAALGAAQGCAVLFHQTNALLSAPALVALLAGLSAPGPNHPPVRKGRVGAAPLALLAAYAAPLALIVGGAYLGVGLGLSGLRSWGELAGWMAGYATTGLWGGPVGLERLPLLGRGLAESFAQPGGALVGLTLLATLLIYRRGLRGAPRGSVAVGLSWLLVYGAFFLWWEPDNIEFWIASLPPFYLLVVLAVWGSGADKGTGRQGDKVRESALARAGQLVLIGCGVAMLLVNGVAISARGDPGRDLQRVAAAALAEGSAPDDLLVAPDGLVELYLPFYEGRNHVASLSQAMAATGGDWGAACALLRADIEEAMAAGHEVRIAAGAIRPAPAPPGEPPTPAERFGLSADDVATCYEPYGPAAEPMPSAAGAAPDYYRLPRAQELADGAGWDFALSRWGWQVDNAAVTGSALPGWALRPGRDPALTSPPLRLDPRRYGEVEVRLAADTTAREAQLFFLDEAGRVDEARSVRWTLEPGPEPHTYTVALRGAPGWEGVVTGLRLDPVSVGDGGVVVVQSLRLVP